MKNIKVITVISGYLCIQLTLGKTKEITIDIRENDESYLWEYFGYFEGSTVFTLNESTFVVDADHPNARRKVLSKQLLKEANTAFYETIRQLKSHPSYRLKVMSMLDDEIRKIWDIV